MADETKKKAKADAADFAEPADVVADEPLEMTHSEAGGGEFISIGCGKVIRVGNKPVA